MEIVRPYTGPLWRDYRGLAQTPEISPGLVARQARLGVDFCLNMMALNKLRQYRTLVPIPLIDGQLAQVSVQVILGYNDIPLVKTRVLVARERVEEIVEVDRNYIIVPIVLISVTDAPGTNNYNCGMTYHWMFDLWLRFNPPYGYFRNSIWTQDVTADNFPSDLVLSEARHEVYTYSQATGINLDNNQIMGGRDAFYKQDAYLTFNNSDYTENLNIDFGAPAPDIINMNYVLFPEMEVSSTIIIASPETNSDWTREWYGINNDVWLNYYISRSEDYTSGTVSDNLPFENQPDGYPFVREYKEAALNTKTGFISCPDLEDLISPPATLTPLEKYLWDEYMTGPKPNFAKYKYAGLVQEGNSRYNLGLLYAIDPVAIRKRASGEIYAPWLNLDFTATPPP